ncbi:hydrogenosomal membrane protein 31 precursor [Histomonas meleagridis]|uniref:hydrogenosomal membrane protein 31 precursor n=1 Tax=Histomonas meleagridis TaxID=135588 RepID=UPI00355A8DDC|nr:hydrogenosomal membrane protein 31 precursor [Histomonas meleagridis]KAH0803001.1 hydrogenosomal membrane protein 31 precursor [Histomonas meleagridis]
MEADQILVATSPAPKVELGKIEKLSVGFIAGTLSRTITSPLDVVKMLMQVSSKGGNVKDILAKLWQEDGIAGFWRGNTAACIRLGPQSAIKFYAFEEIEKRLGKGKPLTGIQRTVAGAAAGTISQVLTYPLDVARTRITVDPKKYNGIFSTLATIVKEEGVTSLYSGILPTIMGVIPYEGAQFYAYGGLKNLYSTKIAPGKPISPFTNCLIGATAGMFSQTFSYPFDVVRKRLMLRDANNKPIYNGTIDAFAKILKEEGPLGLYRGVGLNLVKVVPFAALQFTLVDEVRKTLYRFEQRREAQKAPQKKPRK